MAGDEEMIFSLPFTKMTELLDGIKYVEATNSKFPGNYKMGWEPELPESYMKISHLIGLLKDK
jgi:hypothetical protein